MHSCKGICDFDSCVHDWVLLWCGGDSGSHIQAWKTFATLTTGLFSGVEGVLAPTPPRQTILRSMSGCFLTNNDEPLLMFQHFVAMMLRRLPLTLTAQANRWPGGGSLFWRPRSIQHIRLLATNCSPKSKVICVHVPCPLAQNYSQLRYGGWFVRSISIGKAFV